jgi:hypothetical protein
MNSLLDNLTSPKDESTVFDTHACIGLAWSQDLKAWNWTDQQRNGA